jgi:hypothetical protein
VPDGSGAPVATAVHWPIAVGSAQERHMPLQSVAQQTPCAQKVDAHSVPVEQKAPMGFLPHELCTHVFGVTQSPSPRQVVKHSVPLQP